MSEEGYVEPGPSRDLGRSNRAACPGNSTHYYSATSQSCCFRCAENEKKLRDCPQDPKEDCRKTCQEDYYLIQKAQKYYCEACVSCSRDDLVEKVPCSGRSHRICQCKDGMYCTTSAINTCARCTKHSVCDHGTRIKHQGTPERDTECEPNPVGTDSDVISSQKDCRFHTNCTKLSKLMNKRGNASQDQTTLDGSPAPLTLPSPLGSTVTTLQRTTTSPTAQPEAPSSSPRASDLALVAINNITGQTTGIIPQDTISHGTLFVEIAAVVAASGLVLLLIFQRKSCRKRILKKLHLCPGQVYRPNQMTLDPDFGKNYLLNSSSLAAKGESEESEVLSRLPALETNNNETPGLGKRLSLSLAEVHGSGEETTEPLVRGHTNNRIEKIYIMKAETVIVGSIKGSVNEAPKGKGPVESGCESEVLETDQTPHFPEQETEMSPESHVMFSVEEEGKEFHHPTAVSGK
ncbi:tumor necrosis factor receptor superfamily member 8 [Tachyglossus aculeatus]|uniref:tumor necrosis factor receptor superfamily member 8 n=1 Tax=Tachyglossus aculeatus TaxID=9261 RepID=UPI0018F5C1F9|nr:tumor necrosis factor receptor superfamily member 8 [Tachyglossus aculeatus]